jgi:transposase-like protein
LCLIARGKAHVSVIHKCGLSLIINLLEFYLILVLSLRKRRLAQFNGLSDETFYFHLKESEFRFNNRFNNIYDIMLKELRKNRL